MKTTRIIIIFSFLTVLCLPFLQMEFHFFHEFEDPEKRELAAAPEFTWNRLPELPAGFELFWSDNFGMRPDLIRWNNIMRVELLDVSPVPSVVLGKDHWMFYCSEALDDGNTFEDYRGLSPLSSRELEKLRIRLEANRAEFARHGMRYLVVVVPNKNTVYGEFLPDSIRKSGTTRLDQFMEYMKSHSNVRILDLRKALLDAKNDCPVYWKTDSHWNSFGAYVGYREIVRCLSLDFPGLSAGNIAGAVDVSSSPPGGDLAQMLFMQDVVSEENNTRFDLAGIPDHPQMHRVIFRHDSFGDNLYPYLNRLCEKVINIAPFAPYRFEALEREHPEVVLHVFAERYIPQALHGDFFYREDSENGL